MSPSELSTIGTSIGLQRTFGFTVDKVAKPKRLGNRASNQPRVLSHIQNLFTDENKSNDVEKKHTASLCSLVLVASKVKPKRGRAFVVPRRPSPKP